MTKAETQVDDRKAAALVKPRMAGGDYDSKVASKGRGYVVRRIIIIKIMF